MVKRGRRGRGWTRRVARRPAAAVDVVKTVFPRDEHALVYYVSADTDGVGIIREQESELHIVGMQQNKMPVGIFRGFFVFIFNFIDLPGNKCRPKEGGNSTDCVCAAVTAVRVIESRESRVLRFAYSLGALCVCLRVCV